MADIYSAYMRQRLIDVALGRRHTKRLAASAISEDNITRVDQNHFRVRSEADRDRQYDVDLVIGMCSCEKGQTGAACKHQVACAQMAVISLPQDLTMTPETRRWLMSIAVGESKAPPLSFFADIRSKPTPDEQSRANEVECPAEESAGCSTWDDEDDFQAPTPARTEVTADAEQQ